MKRLLFIWDAAAFGGHDVSALVALEHIAARADLQLGVLHTGRNQRLIDALDRLKLCYPRLSIIVCNAGATRSECLDGLMRGPRTKRIADAVRGWRPDGVVHVQGFITLGLCALAACKAMEIPMISYLPMTHRVWHLKPSLEAFAHDVVNRYWYSLPDAYIVTSTRMGDYLVRLHGVPPKKIHVAEYGPKHPVVKTVSSAEARMRIGVQDKHVVGVVGRVEFFQKQQDLLIKTVARCRQQLGGFCFLLVGDGPDLEKAKHMVRRLDVEGLVRFLPWQDDMAVVYAALDVLLIPSRYEGVPLVMLEAMAHRVPVLASAVDGMLDVLPETCLFTCHQQQEMIEKLITIVRHKDQMVIDMLARLVETRMNTEVFAESFCLALDAFLAVRYQKGAECL